MKLLTRPRRFAVALFALSGVAAGVGAGVAPAQAHEEDGECVAVKAWIYWSDEGRQTVLPYTCAHRTGMHNHFYLPLFHDSNTPPTGWPGGGGGEVWVPIP